MNWYCEKCGEQNEAVHHYRFCWSCGTARHSISDIPQFSTLEDFSAYIKPQKKGAILKRISLLSLAGFLIFICLLIIGLLALISIEVEAPVGYLGSFIAPIMGFILILWLRRARKYATKSQKRMSEDKRAPVLYLRPFKTDEDSELVFGAKTLEELLVSVLDDIGPTVAVGVPGEDLPALGAIRLYFPHSEWQEKVKALLYISQLTVIQAGFSEGVEWELSISMKLLNPKKVAISFLSWQVLSPSKCQSNYEVFLMLVERVLGLKIEAFPKRIDGSYMMYFDNAWVPSLSAPKVNRNTVTEKSIRSSLEPIFKGLATTK